MLEFWKQQVKEFKSDFECPTYTKEKATLILKSLELAVDNKKPWSMIRMGDLEADFIGYKRVDLGKNNATLLKLFSEHLGMNVNSLTEQKFYNYREEFTEYFINSTIPASQWRSPNKDWSIQACKVIKFLGDEFYNRICHVDCVFAYEIVDRGLVFPLLENRKVILIGHPAENLKKCLEDLSWRQAHRFIGVGDNIQEIHTIQMQHDLKGTSGNRIEEYWKQIVDKDFDIALIAGSVPGKILGGRIKEQLGKVVLDLGYGLQQVAMTPNVICPINQKGRRGFKKLFTGRSW